MVDIDAGIVTQRIRVARNTAFQLAADRGQIARAAIGGPTADLQRGVVAETLLAEQLGVEVVVRDRVAVRRVDAAEDRPAGRIVGGCECRRGIEEPTLADSAQQ